jgi:hypothetical protein
MVTRRSLTSFVLVALVLASAGISAGRTAEQTAAATKLPATLTNGDYWSLVTQLSEPDGYFRSDNLVSNEIYFQTLIPELVAAVKPGRVYLGVGPEQNFTYITALKPQMVFIIDVRRGNMHTHLMYKALFELSKDRAEFVSRLFSKARPGGLTTRTPVGDLFSAFAAVETSEAAYKVNLKAIQDHLTKKRELPLSADDLKGIEYVYYHFYWYGPALTYSSSSGGGGGRGNFVNYQSLMVADDGAGVSRSYLATEEHFLYLKGLHEKNLFVPVVGNFGGQKAIRAVGTYLKERNAMVSAFYLSNVEQYLSQDGLWHRFCGNVAQLPIDDSSLFIYSQGGGRGGGGRGGGGGLLSYYRSMQADVKAEKCE